ncbi:hypothetical protein JB92DRAFT_3083974 [Gautieria morchelliformis]|nr:hypothetical protein JB92DRAFT_3083974 [Gautieria morchelliformis]
MTTAVPLDTQVGGHDGLLSSADGSVIIKPCLPLEIDFYNALSSNDAFAHLLPHVPKFYGTLRLHGRMDENGNIDVADADDEETGKDEPCLLMGRSLVLQNLTHSFSKPNVLDVKLGTMLWDEDASAEKRARMEKRARETTSLETGVRLTGFSVYDHTEASFIKTPKAYGRAITKAELPLGIAKYFPLATSDVPRGQGLPRDMLHQVLSGLVRQVETIREAVRKTEMRMVGCSLLVVYEADWDLLRQHLQSWPPDPRLDEEDGSADADGDSEAEEDADSDDTAASDDDRARPPYLAKLIDFGHTSLRAGAGPDMGVIMGLDTTITLFGNRMEEVAGLEP